MRNIASDKSIIMKNVTNEECDKKSGYNFSPEESESFHFYL